MIDTAEVVCSKELLQDLKAIYVKMFPDLFEFLNEEDLNDGHQCRVTFRCTQLPESLYGKLVLFKIRKNIRDGMVVEPTVTFREYVEDESERRQWLSQV